MGSRSHPLLDVGLQHAEGPFVTLQRHLQRGQQPLGRVIAEDDPLVDHDRLGGDARGLGVQSEVNDQLFQILRFSVC